MGKIVVLSRVSTYMQDLKSQTDKLLDYAHQLGFDDEHIIILENHESAVKLSEQERLGIRDLKDAIINDDITDVCVYELSRIARRPDVIFSVRDFLVDHHVQLHCMQPYFKLLDANGNMDANAIITFGIFAALSEQEGFLRKSRFTRGRDLAAKEGRHTGGICPYGYGYDRDNHMKYYIKEDEAAVIRRVYNDYKTMTVRDIAAGLIADEIMDGSINTVASLVRNILNREIYTGKETKITNGRRPSVRARIFPPIISQELFDVTQKKMHVKRYAKSHSAHDYLCRNILFTDDGHLMRPHFSSNSYCFTNYTKEGSKGISVPIELTDKIVWSVVEMRGDMDEGVEGVRKRIADEIVKAVKETDSIRKDRDSKKEAILRIEKRVIAGKLSEEDGDEIERDLRTTLNQLEDELQKAEDRVSVLTQRMDELVEGVRAGSLNISDEDKEAIVRRHVMRITVRKEGIYKVNMDIQFIDGEHRNIFFSTANSREKRFTDTDSGKLFLVRP